jgi:hypothetical protein
VNIAAHLLYDAFRAAFDTAVLITNDSDLVEPVRMVKTSLGIPVGVLNPHRYHSRELKQFATFMKRIRQADLMLSQFPATMTDAQGTFHKPKGW